MVPFELFTRTLLDLLDLDSNFIDLLKNFLVQHAFGAESLGSLCMNVWFLLIQIKEIFVGN
jgi:hypothetical protein